MTADAPPSRSGWCEESVYRAGAPRGARAVADGSRRGRRSARREASPLHLASQTWQRHQGMTWFRNTGTRSSSPGRIVAGNHSRVVVDGCGDAAVVGTPSSGFENPVGERWPVAGGDTGETWA